MANYYWLGFVGLTAAAVQGWMLYKTKPHTTLSSAFTIVSLVLILQHAMEFVISIVIVTNPDSLAPYMHTFMATLYLMALAIVYLAHCAVKSNFSLVVFGLMTALTAIVGYLHTRGLLFGGFEITAYSVISSPGELGEIWIGYGLLIMISTPILLASGLRSDCKSARHQSRVALKALLPIVAVVVAVLALRIVGVESTTAVALPFASTAFLWILMLDERKQFVKFEQKVSDSWTNIIIRAKICVYILFFSWGKHRKEIIDDIDHIMVSNALRRKGNKTDAAEFLSIPRTTLNNILKKRKNAA